MYFEPRLSVFVDPHVQVGRFRPRGGAGLGEENHVRAGSIKPELGRIRVVFNRSPSWQPVNQCGSSCWRNKSSDGQILLTIPFRQVF